MFLVWRPKCRKEILRNWSSQKKRRLRKFSLSTFRSPHTRKTARLPTWVVWACASTKNWKRKEVRFSWREEPCQVLPKHCHGKDHDEGNVIRGKIHCTLFTIDFSRKKDKMPRPVWGSIYDQREIPLHDFYHWFQEPGTCRFLVQ